MTYGGTDRGADTTPGFVVTYGGTDRGADTTPGFVVTYGTGVNPDFAVTIDGAETGWII